MKNLSSKKPISKSNKPGTQVKLTTKLQKELFPTGIKYFSLAWIIYIVIVLLVGYMGYVTYNILQLESDAPSISSVKIDESYIKKLNTLEDFGSPVKSNEPGFGRDDPFGNLGTTEKE
ncbi:MAG: hypothetical protein ABH837_01695 [bacterium]